MRWDLDKRWDLDMRWDLHKRYGCRVRPTCRDSKYAECLRLPLLLAGRFGAVEVLLYEYEHPDVTMPSLTDSLEGCINHAGAH
jgi:hypothetical protein